MLDGACLAPRSEETFHELQGRRPEFQRRELRPEVLEFEPETPVELDRSAFFNSLRSSHRGSSAGARGCTYEHLKLHMDDSDAIRFVGCRLQPDRARQSSPGGEDGVDERHG